MPFTERERQMINQHGYFCAMNYQMMVAYLNVYLDRAPDNRLTAQDCEFQTWILGLRECDPLLGLR